MGTWKTRGLRGSTLEEYINFTNEKYKEQGLALVQKIPTPITPVKMNHETRQITLAYFEKDSTVDYIGVCQGIPICFDAKECSKESFPLQNIHEHQLDFMRHFEKQNGISFLIIYFASIEKSYYMTLRELEQFVERAKHGKKSFHISELNGAFWIPSKAGVLIHYLESLNQDLNNRRSDK